LPKPYGCPSCGERYSIAEREKTRFCTKCGAHSWLTNNPETELPPPQPKTKEETLSSKTAFVKKIYSNVQKQKNSPSPKCDRCFELYFKNHLKDCLEGVRSSKMSNFNHKPCFPPIGSSAHGQVLFVGTNPRCRIGSDDEHFYLYALASEENFLKFSENGRYEHDDSMPSVFDDSHYSLHKRCMGNLGLELGDDSSVTELFMCGSKDSTVIQNARAICANEYLIQYLKLIEPRIIVSLGSPAMQWFQSTFFQDLRKIISGSGGNLLGISEMNAKYSEIELTPSLTSTVIFTLHPNDRNPNKAELHEEFLKTFSRIANRHK
jgi:uracil-DNA glycosylase